MLYACLFAPVFVIDRPRLSACPQLMVSIEKELVYEQLVQKFLKRKEKKVLGGSMRPDG